MSFPNDDIHDLRLFFRAQTPLINSMVALGKSTDRKPRRGFLPLILKIICRLEEVGSIRSTDLIILYQLIVGTAVLTQLVFAVTDPRNHAVPKFLIPLLVGLVVTLIGLSLGFNCGFAINPARDLGPRIFTAMAGYGAEVFT
uniref:Uncharacterized protein n=1 Tax=Romanomermis culicivorax TaxID=13658 RepID=A0A915HFN6_ROMCU